MDHRTRPLGWEMSRHPALYRQLLAAHRPDERGRCAGCRAFNSLAPRSPCGIESLAAAARRIAVEDGLDDDYP